MMEPIQMYLLTQVLLITVLIFASILDVRDRKLRPIVPLALILIISCIINNQICSAYEGIGHHIGINAAVTILITAGLYGLNVIRSRKGKKRLVGGGDIITYATISLTAPILYTGIWLIPASIVLAALAGFIPAIDKSHQKRGIPYIPYLTAAYAAGIILQTAALYVI